MIPEMMAPQNDFSAGELNVDAKRSDDPLVKTGARQMLNWRILNSRKLVNRGGRSALFPADGRTDEVLVAPGVIYRISFGDGTLKIRDAGGTYVAGKAGYAWTAATAASVVWTLVNRSSTDRDIVMCFPGQRPKIARYSAGAWSFLDFAFAVNSSGAQQKPFYRLAPPGVSLVPSATTGVVTVSASANYFSAAMVGTIVRYIEHQILLTAYTDAKTMTGIVLETQPVTINFAISALTGTFTVGDAISSTTSGSLTYEGELAAVGLSGGAVVSMTINMLQVGQQFATSDAIVGPHGTCTAGTVSVVAPAPTVEWDEEAISDFRGWPKSCFFDQNRLGFCDLPAVPGGLAYSGIGIYDNFMVGALPTNPFFEIAPDRAHVYHVVSKGDEFFITDRGIYYCPISETNPLKPGSMQFLRFSADQASSVKPVQTSQAILFVNAGLTRIIAIVVNTHSLYVPWASHEVSLYHSHLIKSPVAMAVASDGAQVPEEYVYVLNSDGTIAVGKFDVAKEWAGWLPWSGGGVVKWVASLGDNLLMTTTYTSGGTPVTIAEEFDNTQYLDGAVTLNAVTANMQAGVEPTIESPLVGVATTTMTSYAAAAAAFDGNPLKNKAGSVGVASAVIGYGNRIYIANTPGAQILSRARVTAPLDTPFSEVGSTTFKIEGSHDGVSWITLYTSAATGGTKGEIIDVTTGIAATAWEYFAIDFFGTSAKYAAVARVDFYYLAPGEIHKAPNAGTGALWWLAGGSVDLMDGVRPLGNHQIDASGNVVLLDPSEDLSSATIHAGIAWQSVLEPFVPNAQAGQDVGQRVKRRRIARAAVSVQNSTGFVMSGIAPVSCNRRISPWNAGDDQAIAPPLREQTYSIRTRGRTHDPRLVLTKDVPGPLTVVEVGFEVSV